MRWLLMVLVVSALGACDPGDGGTGEAIPRDDHFLAMGTLVSLRTYGLDDAQATRARQQVETLFEHLHRRWHPWQPGEVTQLNQALTAGRGESVPADLGALLVRARQLEAASQGRFNPGIGALVGLWGFHSDDLPSEPPAEAAIAALVAKRPRLADLRIQPAADGKSVLVSSVNPAVQVDLGGIAKGYAVAGALALLRQLGVANAMVNAGGDLGVLGDAAGRPWRVAIRNPDKPDQAIAALELHSGEVLFTSGDYERYFDFRGDRYHHLIDPASGHPTRGLRAASVLATDATLADAAATALMVAGERRWRGVAKTLGIGAALVVTPDRRILSTGPMAERISASAAPDPGA